MNLRVKGLPDPLSLQCSSGSGVDGLPTGDVEPNTEGPHQTSPRKAGVAYISEGFIRRIAREENLAQITTLNIMLGKDLNKKIKVNPPLHEPHWP